MRGRGLPGFQSGSTGLIVLLSVLVIASPLIAAATEPNHISAYSTKSQNQRGWGPYKTPSLAIGGTVLEPSKVIAQAATGVPPTGYQPSQPGYQRPRRHIARGAGRGAAVGAVGGAITGNPGKGAAAGAAMGGTVGAFRRRDERMQQNLPPR
jgi:Glycine-zipper domain